MGALAKRIEKMDGREVLDYVAVNCCDPYELVDEKSEWDILKRVFSLKLLWLLVFGGTPVAYFASELANCDEEISRSLGVIGCLRIQARLKDISMVAFGVEVAPKDINYRCACLNDPAIRGKFKGRYTVSAFDVFMSDFPLVKKFILDNEDAICAAAKQRGRAC